MLQRLTPKAHLAFDHACRETLRFHRDHIEPDCLALGIFRLNACDAFAAISERQIQAETLCMEVERRISLGSNWKAAEPLSISDKLEALLAQAVRIAYPFAYAGTKHLLLCLIEHDRGPAQQALAFVGLAEDAALRALRTIPDSEQPRASRREERLHAALVGMTETSLRVLEIARDESEMRRSPVVSCRDVLVAIGTEGSGLAARVLHDAGWNLARLKRLPCDVRQTAINSQEIVFTRRAEEVLIQAHAAAAPCAHPAVHADHLLLALIDADTPVATAMKGAGTDLQAVRKLLESGLARQNQKPRLRAMHEPPVSSPLGDRTSGPTYPVSPQAERALERARQVALEFTHTCIEPEHLLLALLRDPACDAARILTQLGVDLEVLDLAVRRAVHPAPWMQPIRSLPLAGPTRKALEYALTERERLGAEAVTTGLLLRGIVHMPSSRAAQTLKQLGVSDKALAQGSGAISSIEGIVQA